MDNFTLFKAYSESERAVSGLHRRDTESIARKKISLLHSMGEEQRSDVSASSMQN